MASMSSLQVALALSTGAVVVPELNEFVYSGASFLQVAKSDSVLIFCL